MWHGQEINDLHQKTWISVLLPTILSSSFLLILVCSLGDGENKSQCNGLFLVLNELKHIKTAWNCKHSTNINILKSNYIELSLTPSDHFK